MHSGPLYAAIDLGSNSFHLLLARARRGKADIVYRSREKVRLANGLNENMQLSEEAIERGLSCLYDFSDYLKNIPPQHIRAVATATLRKATNRDAIIERFSQALGCPIDMITGEREAALIYQGATWQQQPRARQLVIDIGGASTEVIAGKGQQASLLHSLDMGCVIYQNHYFGSAKITRTNCDSAVAAARQQVQPYSKKLQEHGWRQVMGASGTFKALHEILVARGQTPAITAEFLEDIVAECIACETVAELKFKGLREDRRAVFMGGICILLGLYKELKISSASIATGALREGLLRELVAQKN